MFFVWNKGQGLLCQSCDLRNDALESSCDLLYQVFKEKLYEPPCTLDSTACAMYLPRETPRFTIWTRCNLRFGRGHIQDACRLSNKIEAKGGKGMIVKVNETWWSANLIFPVSTRIMLFFCFFGCCEAWVTIWGMVCSGVFLVHKLEKPSKVVFISCNIATS